MASQIDHLVSGGHIVDGSIIEVQECIKNMAGSKPIIIVLGTTVLDKQQPRIGNPQHVNPAANNNNPAAAAGGGGAGAGVMDPGAAAMLGLGPGGPPPHQQQQPPPAYGAPPPPNPYGPPPPAAAAAAAAAAAHHHQQQPGGYGGGYGAPPPNPYGAPPPPAAAMQYNNNHNNLQQHQQQQPGGYGPPPSHPPHPNPYGAPPPTAAAMPYSNNQSNYPHHQNNPLQHPPPLAPTYQHHGGGVIAKNEAPIAFTPINALNSYQNRWTIKARITAKSDIRRYSNARGEGKFFSFDVLDSQNGEIRVVAWNDVCDRFHDQVAVGQVITLTKASLRAKRGSFNQTRHQFEIHLENASVIEIAPDEVAIPKISFNFVPLSQVEDTPANAMVDVLAVVEAVAEPTTIQKRDGNPAVKRGVNVRDSSGRSIELTLWGGATQDPGDVLATAIASGHRPIIAIKNARVGDFNGKTLSNTTSSTILVDPIDVNEAGSLRSWYDGGGASQAAVALSSRGGGAGGGGRW